MTRQGARLALAGVLLLAAVLVVWFVGPEHGANGWTLVGVGLGVAGLVVAEKAADD